MNDQDPSDYLQWLESLDPDMPVLWYDQQGHSLCKNLSSQLDGIQAFHAGWAAKRNDKWLCGSALTVYSAKDEKYRRDIAAIIKQHMIRAAFAPVKICFFSDSYEADPQSAIESITLGLD